MTELPSLDTYSVAERERISAAWPAVQRYLELTQRPAQSEHDQIRQRRHQAWLRATHSIFFDRATPEAVCKYWSEAASQLIHQVWSDTVGNDSPATVFAMGKLGAEELNLSSDVDLIFVQADNGNAEVGKVQAFIEALAKVTEFGFAFRVDTALRPGGRSAPLLPGVSDFIHYYGHHGEMWERLAQVRLRPIAGDTDVANEVMKFSRKFSFRKHLDYTLLSDLKDLRRKIRAEWYPQSMDEFHLKLGIGGIREIELFVHALQVIHGGRNNLLQTHSTTLALQQLKKLSLLPKSEADLLLDSYWLLRDIENRLQAKDDQQTYLLRWSRPPVGVEISKLTAARDATKSTAQLVASLLGEAEQNSTTAGGLPMELSEQQRWLREQGFSENSVVGVWPQLVESTALSRRSTEDESERKRFLFEFAQRLRDKGLDRDLGLAILLDFTRAVRAKASFFALLNREPRICDDLANLFSCSPYLGQILASRPELLDSYILGRHETIQTDLESTLENLAERRLLSELVASSRFLSDRDLDLLTKNLSRTADAILIELLGKVDEQGSLEIVCMGKWGGQELGLRSDLDFIFICQQPSSPELQKLAKRVLTLLTQPTHAGIIYPVDLRLRPSGQSGPILIEEARVTEYLGQQAAPWERQAYLRARRLNGGFLNASKVGAERGLSPADLVELKMIRAQLFKTEPDIIDLKQSPGGLAYVEFTTQIAWLARKEFPLETSTLGMVQCLTGVDTAWLALAGRITANYRFLREVEQLLQLVTSQSGSRIRFRSAEAGRLARLLAVDAAELAERLQRTLSENVELLRTVDILSDS